MIIVADDVDSVSVALLASIERLSVSGMAMRLAEVHEWASGTSPADLEAIEAFLIGGGEQRLGHIRALRQCYSGPIIAINDRRMLDETLELFAAGADDVVVKPVHARELRARLAAIRRRQRPDVSGEDDFEIRVFSDGRDPLVGGAPLPLRRRELRVLECLVSAPSVWLAKSRIFDFVYGLCDDRVDEAVIESHICRLRKQLKARLGYDPIESQRFFGYRLVERHAPPPVSVSGEGARFVGPTVREFVA